MTECYNAIHANSCCEKGRRSENRAPLEHYYMGIARAVAARANCRKRSVGAIIIRAGLVVATGYNGTPRGFPNCFEGGCKRCESAAGGEDYAKCFCCHAEENAIVQAARTGAEVNGGTMYCLLSPCLPCARMIVNSGIKTVVYETLWDEGLAALDLLSTCKVSLFPMPENT